MANIEHILCNTKVPTVEIYDLTDKLHSYAALLLQRKPNVFSLN